MAQLGYCRIKASSGTVIDGGPHRGVVAIRKLARTTRPECHFPIHRVNR
jgi:hypothetical protein